MKLSDNFTLEELIYSSTAEAKGINNKPNQDEIENLKNLCVNVLQPIRDKYGKAIYINSGYRCPILNRAVGGVPTSQHQSGMAADISVHDYDENKKLFNMIVEMQKNGEIQFDQLIDESNYSWIHVSYDKNRLRNQVLKL